jgi:hypothetical protein
LVTEEKINHPQHYGGDTQYEAIKLIEDWGLGFCMGNALKYIIRAPHKGSELDDLRKALWYVNRAAWWGEGRVLAPVTLRTLLRSLWCRDTPYPAPPRRLAPILAAQWWKLPPDLTLALVAIFDLRYIDAKHHIARHREVREATT